MQTKHWIAIVAPYAITALTAGAVAVAQQLSHSSNALVVVAAGLVLSAIAHRNLYADPPVKP